MTIAILNGMQDALAEMIPNIKQLEEGAIVLSLASLLNAAIGPTVLAILGAAMIGFIAYDIAMKYKDMYDTAMSEMNVYERARCYSKDMTYVLITLISMVCAAEGIGSEKAIASSSKYIGLISKMFKEEGSVAKVVKDVVYLNSKFSITELIRGEISEEGLTYVTKNYGSDATENLALILRDYLEECKYKLNKSDAVKLKKLIDEGIDQDSILSWLKKNKAKEALAEGGINSNYKLLNTSSADDVNTIFKETMGYEPPYKPETTVSEIQLTENSTFVRVYDKTNSRMQGGWVMKAEDIAGLTSQEIQNKFALPTTPKYICDVNLEVGTKLRTGEVNPLFGYEGGGQQYDLIINGKNGGTFGNERIIGQ